MCPLIFLLFVVCTGWTQIVFVFSAKREVLPGCYCILYSLSSADLIVLFPSISTLMSPSIHRSLSSDGWVGDGFRHAFCSGYESPERDHDHHLRLRVPNRDTGESLDHLQTRPSQVNLSFFLLYGFHKIHRFTLIWLGEIFQIMEFFRSPFDSFPAVEDLHLPPGLFRPAPSLDPALYGQLQFQRNVDIRRNCELQ